MKDSIELGGEEEYTAYGSVLNESPSERAM